jgi:multidrug efflux pump subunit AcrA (membrane-fusion protein)
MALNLALTLHAQILVQPQSQSMPGSGVSNLRVLKQSADGTETILTVDFSYDGINGSSARLLPVIMDKKQPREMSTWFGADAVTIGRGHGTVSLRVKFFNDDAGVPPQITTDHVRILMLSDNGRSVIGQGIFARTIHWGSANASAAAPPPEAQSQTKRVAEEKAKAEVDAKAHEEAQLKVEAQAKARQEEEAAAKAQEQARLKAEAEEKIRHEAEAKRLAEEKAQADAQNKEAQLKAEAEERIRHEAEAKRLADEKAKADADAKIREQARLKAEAGAVAKAQEDAKLKAEAEEKARQDAEIKRLAEEKIKAEAESKRLAEEQAKAAAATPPAETAPRSTKAALVLSPKTRSKVTSIDVVNRNIDRTEMTIAVEYQYAKEDAMPKMGIDLASTDEPLASDCFMSVPVEIGKGSRNFVMFPVKLDPGAATRNFKRPTLPTDKAWVYLADGSGQKSYIFQATMLLVWHLPGFETQASVVSAPGNTVEINDNFKQNDYFSGYITVKYNLVPAAGKLRLRIRNSSNPAVASYFASDDVPVKAGPGLQLVRIAVPKESKAPDVFDADTVEIELLDTKNKVLTSLKQQTPMNWAKPK